MGFSINFRAHKNNKKRNAAAACVGALCVVSCVNLHAVASSSAIGASATALEARDVEELLLAVSVNGQKPQDTALLLRGKDGRVFARRDDLLHWRLAPPVSGGVSREGALYFPLDALDGVSYRVDEPQQALLIDAAAQAFLSSRVSGSRGVLTVPARSPLGGFLNYDVFTANDAEDTSTNALAEVGVFNAWGVGVSTFLRQDLPDGTQVVRLGTTWTHDMPSTMTSLRFGDLTNASSSWGRSVRFGGVQWGTNFASQPGFITFPRPAMAGEAVLPSTVDLYVDNVLRMRREVPAGPFSIEDMPVVTGQGEARLVVTDLLGREQVIVAPYYSSPRLLEPGLNAYSYEIGAIREDFGLVSNHYGRPLAVGTFRRGLSEHLTGEVRAELLEKQQTVGLGGFFLWPAAGVFSASIAASHRQPALGAGGNGGLLSLAFSGQRSQFAYGLNAQFTTEHFAQIGFEPGQRAARLSGQAFASFAARRAGSFGISYTHQERPDKDPVDLLNASYSVTLWRFGFLGLSALRVLGPQASSVFSLSFTRLLGERDTGSISATKDGERMRGNMRMQRSLPPGSGMGYRLSAGFEDSDPREAGVTLQNEVATYGVEVGQSEGQTSYRGSVSGGVAMLGADVFMSRQIDNSFAVVEVPGYADVNIYRDNQPIAHTNAKGMALISRLRPYEVNSVRIEQADLPMDARIGALQLDAIPYLRSGLLLSFPVKRSRGATLTLLLDSGEPLPAGAVVKLAGEAEEFPVGLRGETYVTGLEAANQLHATWRGQTCVVDVAFPKSDDPLPDLGVFKCGGVKQ